MILRFDKDELVRELDRLPPRLRAAFAAACAERLLPAYTGESGASAGDHFSLLAEALAYLWRHICDDISDSKPLDEKLASCMSLLPSGEEADGQTRPYASDAVASIVYAMQARLSGNSQEAMWSAQRIYDAVDHAVMSRLNTNLIGKDQEAAIIADATIQSELRRQRADLAALSDVALRQGNPIATILRLQAQARVDAQSLLSDRPRL